VRNAAYPAAIDNTRHANAVSLPLKQAWYHLCPKQLSVNEALARVLVEGSLFAASGHAPFLDDGAGFNALLDQLPCSTAGARP
jgi:hypothetical protein